MLTIKPCLHAALLLMRTSCRAASCQQQSAVHSVFPSLGTIDGGAALRCVPIHQLYLILSHHSVVLEPAEHLTSTYSRYQMVLAIDASMQSKLHSFGLIVA